MFQFHDGSIKGSNTLTMFGLSVAFQFHNGSIKGSALITYYIVLFRFQFHNGSIKGKQKLLNDLHKQVSIPQWFD